MNQQVQSFQSGKLLSTFKTKFVFVLYLILCLFLNTAIAQTPGGVPNTDFKLWLKADAGVTETSGKVSNWDDQSGNAAAATQGNILKQPDYTSENPFFNNKPSIDFPLVSGVGMVTGAAIETNLYSCFLVWNSTSHSSSTRRAMQGSVNWLMGPYNNNTSFYGGAWVYNNTPTASVIPLIATATSNGNPLLNAFFHVNGQLKSAAAGVTATAAPQTLNLGDEGYANEPMGGSIAEVIAFGRLVTNEERRQIESYLAVKYGLTLDQTTASDYYNSTGGVIWNAAANGVYKKNIFALGSESASGLNVTSSRSVSSGIIELSNPSDMLDGDYLFLSDNGLDASPVAEAGLPGGCNFSSARKWNVSKTGNVGFVDITLRTGMANPVLLIDTDNNGSFESAVAATSSSEGAYTFTGVTLENNMKIKIGYASYISPGGIGANMGLWLKAEAGVSVSGSSVYKWDDQSGNAHSFFQEVSGSRPTLVENSINYNPALNFAADFMICPEGILGGASNPNLNVYLVNRISNSSGNYNWMREATSGTQFGIYLPYSNIAYWRPGSTDVTLAYNTTNFPNNTFPNLYSYHSSTTTGQTYTGAKSVIAYNSLLKA